MGASVRTRWNGEGERNMWWMKGCAAAALAMVLSSVQLVAQPAPVSDGLLVVYGPLAPAREGDVDRREQVFLVFPPI